MFFWSTRNDADGWLLDRLELEIKSQPDKRYLIKKAMPQPTDADEQQQTQSLQN